MCALLTPLAICLREQHTLFSRSSDARKYYYFDLLSLYYVFQYYSLIKLFCIADKLFHKCRELRVDSVWLCLYTLVFRCISVFISVFIYFDFYVFK